MSIAWSRLIRELLPGLRPSCVHGVRRVKTQTKCRVARIQISKSQSSTAKIPCPLRQEKLPVQKNNS